MARARSAVLVFDRRISRLPNGKHLRDGLSAATAVGEALWVVNDETLSVERLARAGERPLTYGAHRSFDLADYLRLRARGAQHDPEDRGFEEGDIEGLDAAAGYLWVLGSHSLKRTAPKDGSARSRLRRLARMDRDGNQFLLARIPLVEEDGLPTLARQAGSGAGLRHAAQLPGNESSNLITEALAEDEHLWPFVAIPGKENGLDIEGLAVGAEGRVFLGLRGPVLRGWAVVVELCVAADRRDPRKLTLARMNAKNPHNRKHPTYRKHFLALDGLGIRDLRVWGRDLLLLAGPTMDLNSPFRLYRWRGGARPAGESVVPADRLEKLLELPSRPDGDHAEGLTLLPGPRGAGNELLVVYERASRARRRGTDGIVADVFRLPR